MSCGSGRTDTATRGNARIFCYSIEIAEVPWLGPPLDEPPLVGERTPMTDPQRANGFGLPLAMEADSTGLIRLPPLHWPRFDRVDALEAQKFNVVDGKDSPGGLAELLESIAQEMAPLARTRGRTPRGSCSPPKFQRPPRI